MASSTSRVISAVAQLLVTITFVYYAKKAHGYRFLSYFAFRVRIFIRSSDLDLLFGVSTCIVDFPCVE